MTSDFVIITPELAPGSGGLADHTLGLLRQWRLPERLTVLVPSSKESNNADLAVQQLAATAHEILGQLPKNGGSVFVQYSAYGFNRFGYPRDLIRGLINWKKRVNRGCLVVMFHEIWGFWPVTNRNFVIQQLHRRSIKQLLGVCDAVFTTTPSQAQHLKTLRFGVGIQLLPVGSNVRRHDTPTAGRDEGAAILFGLQASRIRALEQMQKSLMPVVATGRIKRIVTVGQGSNDESHRRERQLLQALNLPAGFVQHGALPEQKVSELLGSVSFGIFGQNELSCPKSGSFMAYAAHQLNVIADFAEATKPPPICWLVSPSQLADGMAKEELERRAECLRMWQEENCSWQVIGNTVGRALGIESIPSNNR